MATDQVSARQQTNPWANNRQGISAAVGVGAELRARPRPSVTSSGRGGNYVTDEPWRRHLKPTLDSGIDSSINYCRPGGIVPLFIHQSILL